MEARPREPNLVALKLSRFHNKPSVATPESNGASVAWFLNSERDENSALPFNGFLAFRFEDFSIVTFAENPLSPINDSFHATL